MKGLPGSGKSTRAAQIAKQSDAVIVSRDELHSTSRYFRHIENELKAGRSVVADATNFTTMEVMELMAQLYDAKLQVEFLDTPVEECIRRDHERALFGDRVGARVIRGMYNDFLKEDND